MPTMPTIFRNLLPALGLAAIALTGTRTPGAELVLPNQPAPVFLAVDLPKGLEMLPGQTAALIEEPGSNPAIPAQIVPAMTDAGTVAERGRLVAVVPPREGANAERRFRVRPADDSAVPFEMIDENETTLKVVADGNPVLAYNYGTMVGENVPERDPRRRRACYIHPVWGLHGEVLTDDFPRDHYHHHGIFWAWPHIGIEGRSYDSWHGRVNFELRKVDWLHRATGPAAAVLAVENGWFIDPELSRKIMVERVWIRAFRAMDGSRAVDLEFTWIPTEAPITLRGVGGKSYGGLTMRFLGRPHKDQVITVPSGPTDRDLPMTRLEWVDFSRHFDGAPGRSGATVMVHPEHPDFPEHPDLPPQWLTRQYGPLCIGWPGVKAQTFEPGEPIRLMYRIWIHADDGQTAAIQQAYDAYAASAKARWE